MKDLFEGIYDVYNTVNDFKTGIGSRFYLYEAPQGTAFPYSVYTMVSLVPDFHFSTNELLEPTIQISIFSKDTGATEVVTLWGYMTALFDDAAISVDGYSTVEIRRDQARLLRDPEDNIWHYATDYDIILGK